MEELKATQEESSRREEELKGIADAIGNTLYVIEYDLEGLFWMPMTGLPIFLGRDRRILPAGPSGCFQRDHQSGCPFLGRDQGQST
jgi:hypothetical protein